MPDAPTLAPAYYATRARGWRRDIWALLHPPYTAWHLSYVLLGAGLAARLDVARLVADGLTNKQIGTRLFISERTVESHVRTIMNKLGFTSRAQIAGWMAAPDR